MKTKLMRLCAGVLALGMVSARGVSAKGPYDAPPPIYTCYKISAPVTIDGKLSDVFWKDIPRMPFAELASGGPPWFDCYCQAAWDDKYLYVAFWGADPDVVASVRPGLLPKELPLIKHRTGKMIPTFEGFPFIMLHDPLFMVFINPDADGRNHEEFHINALNTVNYWWFERGSTSREWQDLSCGKDNMHLDWDCEGLQHAVWVYGTLNDSSDTDVGWSAELAIPFSALKQFTKGSIPPRPGDAWAVHTGWEYRPGLDQPRIYWTWPVIGIVDDHQLWRFGKFVFAGTLEAGPVNSKK